MPLPTSSTVADIRTAVLDRLGLPTDGTASANGFKQVESLIRQAARIIAAELNMLVQRTSETVTLTADNPSLDFPQDAEAIEMIEVVNTQGHRFTVLPGVRQQEREVAVTGADVVGGARPIVYEILDGNIYLRPAPSTEWPTAIIYYTKALSGMVNTSDPVDVDAEAVTQLACILWREDKGLPVPQDVTQRYETYMRRIRSQQSSGSGLTIGGPKSQRWKEPLPNRVANQQGRFGSGVPFTPDWNPF